MTPLLWKGYWDPLELTDLGNLYEKNTCRYHYDQFLFIYQNGKVSEIINFFNVDFVVHVPTSQF